MQYQFAPLGRVLLFPLAAEDNDRGDARERESECVGAGENFQ